MSELFIDGEWAAGTGPAFASHNPGTGAAVWEGNSASADDVDRAVRSARRAFAAWSALSLDERCGVVRRFAALVTERKEALAEAIGRETGKPLWEARTEAASMAAKVEISIQAYNERTGEKRSADGGRHSRASASSAWRGGGVWAVQLSGPFAERAYRAGADRGQCGRIQAVGTRARRSRAHRADLARCRFARRRAESRARREGHWHCARESSADRRPCSSPAVRIPERCCTSNSAAARKSCWRWKWAATIRS